MNPRIPFANLAPEQMQALAQVGASLENTLDPSLFGLVHNRASQLNGCAFCLDMDVKKAKMRGESERKMYHIAVWHESPLFNARERAALEWTEALTRLDHTGVSDEVYQRVKQHFSDKELVYLTLAISMTNTWNRINVAFKTPAGAFDATFGLDKSGLK